METRLRLRIIEILGNLIENSVNDLVNRLEEGF